MDKTVKQVTDRTEDPIPEIVTIMSNGKQGGTEVFINGIRVTQNCESVSWSHDARGVPRVKLVMVGAQIEALGGEAQIEDKGRAIPPVTDEEMAKLNKTAEHDPYWRPR